MGFHIGLHYGMIMGIVKKAFSTVRVNRDRKKQIVCKWILRGMAVFIATYGIHALYTRKFLDYISQKVMFAFFDYEEPVIYFAVDYATIMGLMIFISYYLQKFLQGRILPIGGGNQKHKSNA